MPTKYVKNGRSAGAIGFDFQIRTDHPEFVTTVSTKQKSELRKAAENLQVGEWIEIENADRRSIAAVVSAVHKMKQGVRLTARTGVNGKMYIGRLPNESTNGS